MRETDYIRAYVCKVAAGKIGLNILDLLSYAHSRALSKSQLLYIIDL